MNPETQIMINRASCLMESLFNLGIYFMENGAVSTVAVQNSVGKEISKEEYIIVLYAMDVLKRINPRRKKSETHDEYVRSLRDRIKFRRHYWLVNLLTKLFTPNSSKLTDRLSKKWQKSKTS